MVRGEGAEPRDKSPFMVLTRQERIALVVVFILALGYAVWHVFLRYSEKVDLGSDIDLSVNPPISVQVEGAVVHPGMVKVPQGAKVSDAIEKAGGFLPQADRGAVEMGSPVSEGAKIVVPFRDEKASPEGSQAVGGEVRININTASQEELESLPYIGEVLARRIIEYRNTYGPFRSVEELINVKGIGEKTLEKIKPFITVE